MLSTQYKGPVHPQLGMIVGPRVGGIAQVRAGAPWCADNDAFHGRFTPEGFRKHLLRVAPYAETCHFVIAPDVVSDPVATAALYSEWAPEIRSHGLPVAWAAQNGATPDDIPECEAVFIGGDTEWKLGHEAALICRAAQARGLWVHMGRVNSRRRMILAARMGVDSVDGTYVTYRGEVRGRSEIMGWLHEVSEAGKQPRLL